MLSEIDPDLHFANDGHQAVSLYESLHPDIGFMDISMPGLDGIAATAKIREYERENDRLEVPIVALTAHAMASDAQEILASGLDYYLTKPLKRDELMAILDQVRSDLPPQKQTPTYPPQTTVAESDTHQGQTL